MAPSSHICEDTFKSLPLLEVTLPLGANMQYPRTTLALLSGLALFLLGHFYSDVFHTVLVEKFLGLVAHDIFGTETPIMLSYIDPYIVPFCILSILTFA